MSIQKHILADPRNKVEEKVEKVKFVEKRVPKLASLIEKEADMKVKKLLQEISDLKEEVSYWKSKANQNSKTSSKPPSTDLFKTGKNRFGKTQD